MALLLSCVQSNISKYLIQVVELLDGSSAAAFANTELRTYICNDECWLKACISNKLYMVVIIALR